MKKILSVVLLTVLGGCTSMVKCEDVTVNGGTVSYCMGKVSGDGQEGNFRDAYIDGKPVLSHYGSGSSLWGQTLQGAGGDAAIAGGMYGAARALRPSREYNSVGSANEQVQGQSEGQIQGQSAASTASPTVTSTSTSKGGNANSTSSAKGGKAVSNSNSNSSSTSSSSGSVSTPKAGHVNHSGGGDETNPGGHGNDGGYDNPGKGHKD